MYNADKPDLEDLPSSARLFRSTIVALIAAVVILVTLVLPAEYGIDPTRVGRIIGLTEMGEIKKSLAEEAEQDRRSDPAADQRSDLLQGLFELFVGAASAAETEAWTDQIKFTLKPGEGIEWKLVMEKDAVAQFRWVAEHGRVNFDLHGDGGDQSISYKKGRGVTWAEGEIVAAFSGNHGWFWRNRDKRNVTVTLQLRGDYSELKQTY